MPTNPEKWTIFNKTGALQIGDDLTGLLIKKTGTSYELYGILKKVQKNSTPTGLPVTFTDVLYDGVTWDITVNSLPNPTNAGTWLTPSASAAKGLGKDVPPQSGEFTAQAGGEVDADDEAASSAKA